MISSERAKRKKHSRLHGEMPEKGNPAPNRPTEGWDAALTNQQDPWDAFEAAADPTLLCYDRSYSLWSCPKVVSPLQPKSLCNTPLVPVSTPSKAGQAEQQSRPKPATNRGCAIKAQSSQGAHYQALEQLNTKDTASLRKSCARCNVAELEVGKNKLKYLINNSTKTPSAALKWVSALHPQRWPGKWPRARWQGTLFLKQCWQRPIRKSFRIALIFHFSLVSGHTSASSPQRPWRSLSVSF